MKRISIFRSIFIQIILVVFAAPTIQAQTDSSCTSSYDCCRPDGHAPLGIQLDHVHGKNTWSVSYTYMSMWMQGNRNGTTTLSDEDVYTSYTMAPHTMTMQMHMLMVMYGITPRLTLMGMGHYVQNEMTMHMAHHNHTGTMPTLSQSSGIGDAKLELLYKAFESCGQQLIFGLGASVPTGSISVSGVTMISANDRLSYAMQPGTGSWSILPGAVYTGQNTLFSWGGQLAGDIKTGKNAAGYTWGNSGSINAWFAWKCSSWLSTSLRAEGTTAGAIRGSDPIIAASAASDPNANAANYGGQRASVYFGLNFYKAGTPVQGLRLQAEYGMPVYQQLNGPQMNARGTLLVGALYTF
jgi:hypothetical protein